MPEFEQNDNSGALFTNDKKGNERAPDYSGPCMVNGAEMRVAGWLKTSKSGQKYMSLAFSEPMQKQQPTYEDQAGGGPTADPLDDEIPF